VHHEPSGGGIGGIEGETQQTLLTPGGDLAAEIEERVGPQRPVLYDADGSALLHDEEPRVSRGRREIEREIEAGGDLLQCDRHGARRRPGRFTFELRAAATGGGGEKERQCCHGVGPDERACRVFRSAGWPVDRGRRRHAARGLGISDPALEVARVRLEPAGTGASPLMALAVRNPNDYELTTDRPSWRCGSMTFRWAGSSDSAPPCPKIATAAGTALQLAPGTTPERLAVLGQGTRHFSVSGRARFRTPFGVRIVRFAGEGQMVFGGG
jgi:hypothetical protein